LSKYRSAQQSKALPALRFRVTARSRVLGVQPDALLNPFANQCVTGGCPRIVREKISGRAWRGPPHNFWKKFLDCGRSALSGFGKMVPRVAETIFEETEPFGMATAAILAGAGGQSQVS
jgi:hypothetical protein